MLRHLVAALSQYPEATLFAPLHLNDVVTDEDGTVVDALLSTPDGAVEEVTSATGLLEAYHGQGALAAPYNVLLTWATVMHGGIVVNAHGERFDDETMGYSKYGARALAQPNRVAWVVFDGRIHELCQLFADYDD